MSSFSFIRGLMHGLPDRLIPRWIFLRALGVIYLSAFYSLYFQIKGLVGPEGLLPAQPYLTAIAHSVGGLRYWIAPSLLWISARPGYLSALCIVGMIGSLLLVFNIWPRGMLVLCLLCFLSFVSAAQDFSGYQSDGMLLEAGFISIFLAPSGFRPRWGEHSPPTRLSYFLLQWEWFRIYFESGAVKLLSGDPEWRNLSAMDEYYQNGPLPTWVGWYLQHLPHSFHWLTALGTLIMELALVWMAFLGRHARLICFYLVTLWQIGVIISANYTFLNYLVLALGFLLLDDKLLGPLLGNRFAAKITSPETLDDSPTVRTNDARAAVRKIGMAVSAFLLCWILYATSAQLVWMFWPRVPLPKAPVNALEPFRVANSYGLFAVMTRARYEIEFQGSNDGVNWAAYAFKYKPQSLNEAPGIYAPYQPRFDWNLWFASLGGWRENMFVVSTEERLLSNGADVLKLFGSNPFPNGPPKQVRAVLWQYWFTSMAEKRQTGNWWRREYLGTYAPTLANDENGKLVVLAWPSVAGGRQ